jgi:hypothetical protein
MSKMMEILSRVAFGVASAVLMLLLQKLQERAPNDQTR